MSLDLYAEICNGSLLQQGVAGALMVVPSGGVAMTKRVPVEPAPGPLEDYAESFDALPATLLAVLGVRPSCPSRTSRGSLCLHVAATYVAVAWNRSRVVVT